MASTTQDTAENETKAQDDGRETKYYIVYETQVDIMSYEHEVEIFDDRAEAMTWLVGKCGVDIVEQGTIPKALVDELKPTKEHKRTDTKAKIDDMTEDEAKDALKMLNNMDLKVINQRIRLAYWKTKVGVAADDSGTVGPLNEGDE